jgi:hypothetical protein
MCGVNVACEVCKFLVLHVRFVCLFSCLHVSTCMGILVVNVFVRSMLLVIISIFSPIVGIRVHVPSIVGCFCWGFEFANNGGFCGT